MAEHILGEVYEDEDFAIRATVETLAGVDIVQADVDTITLTTKNMTTGVQSAGVSLTVADVITDAATPNFEHTISHATEGLYTDTVDFLMQDESQRSEVFQVHVKGLNH